MNLEEYQSRNATSSAGLIGKEELTVGNVLHPPVSDLDEHTSRSAATGIADGPCFGLPRTKNLGAAPGGTVATDGWLLLADAPGATDDSESVDPGRRPPAWTQSPAPGTAADPSVPQPRVGEREVRSEPD